MWRVPAIFLLDVIAIVGIFDAGVHSSVAWTVFIAVAWGAMAAVMVKDL